MTHSGDPAVAPMYWKDLLSPRLSNGYPDWVTGISKILLYLMKKKYWDPDAYAAAEKLKDEGKLTEDELANLDKYPPVTTTMEIRLPKESEPYLDAAGIPNGGLGTVGDTNPLDLEAPPRAVDSARGLQRQIAALMGVYQPENDYADTAGASVACGLFTKDGNTTPAECPFIDKRKYATGWINGRWYGYPPASKWDTQTSATYIPGASDSYPGGYSNLERCQDTIGANYVAQSKTYYTNGGIYTKGGSSGTPGAGPSGNPYNTEVWTEDGYFMPTEDNPLVYYGLPSKPGGKPEELYRTWYGKPITMDYVTACKLAAAFYSMGDTGWDAGMVCWPFGSYFAYAEDLGVGKYIIGGNLLSVFGANSLHYTMTSTSLAKGALTSPAYDYEIVLTLDDPSVTSINCFCDRYAKSVDLLHDDGNSLIQYTNPAKGAFGGWFPPEAAVDYDGSSGLSNFTDVMTGSTFVKNESQYLANGVLPTDQKSCWCSNPNGYCYGTTQSYCETSDTCKWDADKQECVDICAVYAPDECPDQCYSKYKDTRPQSEVGGYGDTPVQDLCLFARFDPAAKNHITGKTNELTALTCDS